MLSGTTCGSVGAYTVRHGRTELLAIPTFLVALESLVAVGLVEHISAELGTSLSSTAQATSAFTFAAAFSGVPLAGVTSHLPKRRLLVTALLVQAAVNLTILGAPSLPVLLMLRAVSGAAASLIPPNAAALAAQMASPDRRATALAWTTGGVVAAFLVGLPFATLLGESLGWRASFALCMSIACVGAVALQFGLPDVTAIRPAPSFRHLRLSPALLLTLATTVLGFAASFCVIGFSGPIIAAIAAWPVGFIQIFLGLGAVVGLLSAVRIAGRIGSRAIGLAIGVILLSLTIQVGAVNGAFEKSGWMLQTVALIVLGAGLFGLSPPIQLSLIRASPAYPEIALAMNAAAVFVGQGLGAVGAGSAVGNFGILGAPVAGLLFGGLAMVAAVLVPRIRDRAH